MSEREEWREMTKESGNIQLSHLGQTIYFASQQQGVHLLGANSATDLVGVSRRHAVSLLASMAQQGALYRVGRRRHAVIPLMCSMGAGAMEPIRT